MMGVREPISVCIAGSAVPLEIRRRKGTRHMRLSFGQKNQVVASVPVRCSDRQVLKFIETQRSWLEAQSVKIPKACNLLEWFREHPQLSASGDVFTVTVVAAQSSRAGYKFANGGADILLALPDRDDAGALKKLVRRFANDALECRLAYHAKRLGLKYSRLTVRDQLSRWGSCSQSGTVSLNWRLVLLAPKLQDYVILHELAHLKEMNHSPNFWALLDQYDPERVAHEVELDHISPTIMRVGR